jgi:hypothetical protein
VIQSYYNNLELPNDVIITFDLSVAKKRGTGEIGPTAALGWQRNPWGRRLVPFAARNSPNTRNFGSERDEIDKPSLSLLGNEIKNIRCLKSLETETAYTRRYKLLNAV